MIYCFDTSGWIQGWNDLYPQDTFPSLWDNIDKFIQAGKVVSPDEVMHELKRKDDGVFRWAKARPDLFIKLEGTFMAKSVEITNRYKRMLDQRPGKNGADPLVIALALDRKATVVTMERASGGLNSPKIPDVCRAEKVECVDLLAFIKAQRWKW